MKWLLLVSLFVIGCSKPASCPPEKTCPPPPEPTVCPPAPACPTCPVCPDCPTCAVCPAPLGYDAVGSLTYWVTSPGRAGTASYIAATAYHRNGAWDFDLINSTGGPKSLADLRSLLDPTIALNHALATAKDNRGQGSVSVDGVPYDFGRSSGGSSIWLRGDDGYTTTYSVAVVLIGAPANAP